MAYRVVQLRAAGLRRWSVAAAVAFSLHAGAATALVYWSATADDEEAGTLTVELAAVATAPAPDSPKVAHGPLMHEQVATPTAVKQVAEDIEAETPQLDPSPAPEPEVTQPRPQEVKEVDPEADKQQREVLQETAPAQASPNTVAMAPPPIDVPPAARAAAPVAGVATTPSQARASWHGAIVSHLNRFKHYPQGAQARGIEGTVTLEFNIDRAGRVVASRVALSSGSGELDSEALAALQRASPLPQPPDEIAGASFDLGVPFQFRVKR